MTIPLGMSFFVSAASYQACTPPTSGTAEAIESKQQSPHPDQGTPNAAPQDTLQFLCRPIQTLFDPHHPRFQSLLISIKPFQGCRGVGLTQNLGELS